MNNIVTSTVQVVRTHELLAKLRDMASQAGEALYLRVGYALKLTQDKLWCADFPGGLDGVYRMLEDDCFPDLPMSLGNLFTLYADCPRSVWQETHWNVRLLWAKLEKQRKAEKQREDEIEAEFKRKEAERVAQERLAAGLPVESYYDPPTEPLPPAPVEDIAPVAPILPVATDSGSLSELETLRAENERLRAENAMLKQRLAELTAAEMVG